MNQLVSLSKFAVADSDGIFAPISPDLLGGLLRNYELARKDIAAVSGLATSDQFCRVMRYFADGNTDPQNSTSMGNAIKLFGEDGAVAALNSDYWRRALQLTDVYEIMPQKRRDEWNEQIRKMEAPEFTADTVIPTIIDLLNMRPKFLAERVDGIFRSLSHEHVTNCPQGFNKRMILYVMDSLGFSHTSNCGHITDLRKVIAKFMGRDEPTGWDVTYKVIDQGKRQYGEWITIDGGAMRMRVYKKGTAHLEIHPDMAWRLNSILAHLYPLAIPPEFRTKPKRKPKEFKLMQRPLPFAVVEVLGSLKQALERSGPDWRPSYNRIPNTLGFSGCNDKHIEAEVEKVLQAIGGVRSGGKGSHWVFDYDPTHVVGEVVSSGCIPDYKSHQFYPTPEKVAQAAVALAMDGYREGMWWLEPSAGIGNLADLFPDNVNVNCYEISKLHCSILEAKGYGRAGSRTVHCLDFLQLASEYRGGGYDRVVMNPPYSQGRWKAHVEAAAVTVKHGGVLVAILPSSAKNKFELDGFECTWSDVYENEFAGTSTDVVILKAVRHKNH